MNKSLILNKIKIANNLNTDTELAIFLGVTKSVLSNWRGRDTIDFELVLSKCEHLDLNWLIKENDEEVIKLGGNEINTKLPDNLVKILNEESLNIIMDRYETLAKETGYAKKENEVLKSIIESANKNKSPETTNQK